MEPKAEKIYEVSIPPKFVGLREFGARRLGRMVAVALGRRRGTELGDIGRVLRLE